MARIERIQVQGGHPGLGIGHRPGRVVCDTRHRRVCPIETEVNVASGVASIERSQKCRYVGLAIHPHQPQQKPLSPSRAVPKKLHRVHRVRPPSTGVTLCRSRPDSTATKCARGAHRSAAWRRLQGRLWVFHGMWPPS